MKGNSARHLQQPQQQQPWPPPPIWQWQQPQQQQPPPPQQQQQRSSPSPPKRQWQLQQRQQQQPSPSPAIWQWQQQQWKQQQPSSPPPPMQQQQQQQQPSSLPSKRQQRRQKRQQQQQHRRGESYTSFDLNQSPGEAGQKRVWEQEDPSIDPRSLGSRSEERTASFSQQQQQPLFWQSSPNPFLQQQQQQQHFQPQFQSQFQPQPQQQFQPQPQPQFQFQFQPQPQLQFQPQVRFQFQPQQPQQPQQPMLLYKVDKTPASYNTKFEDLHPDSQNYILQVQDRILEYGNESQLIDQCSRLYDSSISYDGFKLDATHITQELGGISIAIERERNLLQKLLPAAQDMIRNTGFAVHSFIMLHSKFRHVNIVHTSNVGAGSQITGAASASSCTTQPIGRSVPAFDFYSGIPKRPSPFFIKTVFDFEKYLPECRKWIEELEQFPCFGPNGAASSSGTSLQSLPTVISNVYDYFVYVAAKVENLHQKIETMKTAYLAQQRCGGGDRNDPFLEADRRETAKLEAAARRVHPTLHLPAISSQPSNQVYCLFASPVMPGASGVPHQYVGSYGTPAPYSASTSSSSLFSTPSPSTPASKSTSKLFSSSGFSPQSPSVASSPDIGSSPPSSMPPFASGPATGSGPSLGAASKASKLKPRPKSRRRQ